MNDQIKLELIKECQRQMNDHHVKRLDTYNRIKGLTINQIQNQRKMYANGCKPDCDQDRMLIGYLFQELCKCKLQFENLEHLRGSAIKRYDESLDRLNEKMSDKNEEIANLKRQLEAKNPINPNPEYIGEGLKDINTTLNNQLGMMNETLKQIHYGMP